MGIKNNKRDLINELFYAINLSVFLFSAPKGEKEENFLILLNVLYRLNDFTRSPKTVTCHLRLQYWLVVIFQVLRDKWITQGVRLPETKAVLLCLIEYYFVLPL